MSTAPHRPASKTAREPWLVARASSPRPKPRLRYGGVRLPTAERSLAVADQDLVTSCADLRTVGLQASQHPHGVVIRRLAELAHGGRAGRALLRRSLLLS